MKKSASVFLVFILFFSVTNLVTAQQTQIQYLSGTDKDHTVEWDFYCSKGRNSRKWTTIPVPSCWEFQGFGTYNYGKEQNLSDEQGKYRHTFTVPMSWAGKKVYIVFEGSMTDTEVWINHKPAGPKHQGAFYRFKYDITDLVKIGDDNLLEMTVSKMSSNQTVNDAERSADYWVFGGIFRPVYLQSLPRQFIEWTAIDALADGSFSMNIFLGNLIDADHVSAQIVDPDGNFLNESFSQKIVNQQEKVTMKTKISGHKTWTAETPNLYTVRVSLMKEHEEVHRIEQRFGFRTIEHRIGDGIYINGKKIKFKGVCRHAFWPDSGRTTSPEVSFNDVRLMKEMNMNAVRMSHYPPDVHFLQACDQLGLYVLDELAGWWGYYDTDVGRKLVREMVKRDVTHPSVIFWDNGNESGWNFELDDEFAKYDPQGRTVIHPSARFKPPNPFNNINTDHYRTYGDLKGLLAGSTIVMPTELLHGLYDGGHGAGLDDYWKLMWNSPMSAGCFLWVFADEGAVRTDRDGQIDVVGNQAPDGIVGPYRQKEGSFYTIAQIWSPIQTVMTELPKDFDGTIEIENQYDFINLSQCQLKWELVNFYRPEDTEIGHKVISKGMLRCPSAKPGEKAVVKIPLPSKWKNNDALYLTAIDHTGRELWTWSWPLKVPGDYLEEIINKQQTRVGKITAVENDDVLEVSAEKLGVKFDKTTGTLLEVSKNGRKFSLSNGPIWVGAGQLDKFEATEMKIVSAKASDSPELVHANYDDHYIVEVKNPDNFEKLLWKIYADGTLELNYRYQLSGDEFDFFGVSFDYPEDKMLSMKWLGQGPYRVWKNRMKGTTLNVWQRQYNNTATGQTWLYPEFKGYYADLNWVVLDTAEGDITITTYTPDMYLRVYTPPTMGPSGGREKAPFPSGDISFMHAIPPIGTKFNNASDLGPSGQLNISKGKYTGQLRFQFE